MQKKGRSKPSSVYSSMTCLLLFGPWRSSMRALSGRPSVLRQTWTESTSGSNGYVRSAPPWMVVDAAMQSADGCSTSLALQSAAMGNSIWPMLRIATVLGPRGVARAALGREGHLHVVHHRRAVRPRAERAALHEDDGVGVLRNLLAFWAFNPPAWPPR